MSARTMPETVAPSHFPLAALLWPHRADGSSGLLRSVILVALGTALLTLSAKVNLPLPYVPMTLQTLVVLVIGAAYGWRLGSVTLMAYLAEGAIGFPVFAGPVGGLAPLIGPTAGYLFGFVAAAFVTGWLSERGWDRSVLRLFVAMAFGHISHSRRRIWLAGVRHETRRRKGVAGRHRAVHRGVPDQECARRGTPCRRSGGFSTARLDSRVGATPLTPLAQRYFGCVRRIGACATGPRPLTGSKRHGGNDCG